MKKKIETQLKYVKILSTDKIKKINKCCQLKYVFL